MNATADSQTVIIRRKFLKFDPTVNSNKVWMIEVNTDGTYTTFWGRVGNNLQSKSKPGGQYEADRIISNKLGEGYHEVALATPAVVVDDSGAQASVDSRVAQIVEWIFAEAGESISRYLNTTVDALSPEQIAKGRRLLQDAIKFYQQRNMTSLKWAVSDYYSTIPTRLPSKIDLQQLVKEFLGKINDIETELDQLEAAVKSLTVTRKGGSNASALNATLTPLEKTSKKYQELAANAEKTTMRNFHGFSSRIKQIFEIEIPAERKAFEAEHKGASDTMLLYHGTNAANLRHILNTGLKIGTTMANGAMFGRGLYFADLFSKSGQYCRHSEAPCDFMLVAEVKTGKKYIAPGSGSWTEAPAGYDSVMGAANHSQVKNNEYIVYKASQATLRYLIVWEKGY